MSSLDVKVLQWLTKEFKLGGVDARARDNYAFQLAAQNGHLHVLKWLRSFN